MSRILQITVLRYPEIVGGVDMMVSTLVERLKQRHHVCVLVPGAWEQKGVACRLVDGVPVYSIRLRLPVDRRRPLIGFLGWLVEFPKTLFRLRSLVKKEGIDLIHAHLGVPHQIYFRFLRWIGGPPYVITLHRGDVVEHGQFTAAERRLVRLALRGAAKVNAVSRWLAKQAEGLFPECAPISWIYNGIDVSCAQNPNQSQAPLLPSSLPSRYGVMVGSFDPYKGHDLAFNAWKIVKSLEPDLHLVVIGDGALRSAYAALIAELGCADRIHLVGEIRHDEVLRIIAAAQFMVFPSRNEGLGYVILEAGMVGVPVLCTRIPVFEELIEDNVNGRLVPLNEPGALADAAVELARAPELRKALGEALHAKVLAGFSAESMTTEYEALYSLASTAIRNPSPVGQEEQ